MGMRKESTNPFRNLSEDVAWMYKIALVLLSTVVLLFSMVYSPTSGIYLDYLYILLPSFAGFWFGLKGGVITALLSMALFTVLARTLHKFFYIDMSANVTAFRFALYFFAGSSFGLLSDKEKRLKKRLEFLSRYDELTGCANYRYIMEIMEKELNRCQRYGKHFSLAMMDVDFFKRLNDLYGHLAGNEIIKIIAQTIKNNLRDSDTVGRYGGDEFLLIFPEAMPQQAYIALTRVAEILSDARIESAYLKKTIRTNVSFSAGIVSFPYNGRTIQDLIALADYGVYRAKQSDKHIIIEKRRHKRFIPDARLRLKLHSPELSQAITPVKIMDISSIGTKLLIKHKVVLGEGKKPLHYLPGTLSI